jgi:hypothetical protein
MGDTLSDENALTRSFMEDSDEEDMDAKESSNEEESKGGGGKANRSTVVDELVSRMPSAANASS